MLPARRRNLLLFLFHLQLLYQDHYQLHYQVLGTKVVRSPRPPFDPPSFWRRRRLRSFACFAERGGRFRCCLSPNYVKTATTQGGGASGFLPGAPSLRWVFRIGGDSTASLATRQQRSRTRPRLNRSLTSKRTFANRHVSILLCIDGNSEIVIAVPLKRWFGTSSVDLLNFQDLGLEK